MSRIRKVITTAFENLKRNWQKEEILPANFKLKKSESFHDSYYLWNSEELEKYAHCAILKKGDEFHLYGLNAYEKSKGYGTMIMKFIIAKAYQENIKKIRLDVFRDNYIAMKLYTKFNFVEETPVYKRISHIATLTLTLKEWEILQTPN